jgi:predicted RND superfamily exporter protein
MKFIISSGKQAAILAIILVAMTVFLSIRKISYSVITLFPLFIGSVLTFGFMGYMDIKLTYITILVIPMLIGIGIDDGAHIISSYLIHKEHINSTIHRIGRAILLTTLTTAIAFGSLYFSKFEGYKQFGLALFFGISIMFIITITLIPSAIAILDFYSKRTPRK